MNWTKINEISNLTAILLELVAMYVSFLKLESNQWIKILFFNFLIMSILDISVFYCYKFLDINLHWIDPFYIFINILSIPLFIFYSLTNQKARRYVILTQVLLFIFVIVRMIIRNNISSYDQWTWLILQIVMTFLLLYSTYFVFTDTKKVLFKNSLLNVNLAYILMYFMPLLSNFFQYEFFDTSEDYYQISLLILNVTACLALLIIIGGILKLRKKTKPTSSPTPSPPLRGQN